MTQTISPNAAVPAASAPLTRRVAVVVNGAAGGLLRQPDARENLLTLFAAAGLQPEFVPLDAGTLPQRVALANRLNTDAVIVAGGDGTIACAAQVLAGTATPLGILPFGTMNLLARDLGIPTGAPEEAIRIIATGSARSIDIADVNNHVFVYASILGLPARLGRFREAQRQRVSGPWLWVRLGLAAMRLLRTSLPRRFVLAFDGRAISARAASITLTANAVDEPDGRRFGRARLDAGELVIYLVHRLTLLRAARLALAWWKGSWHDAPNVTEYHIQSVVLHPGRRAVRAMNDGEQVLLHPPLRYNIRPRALRVLVPAE